MVMLWSSVTACRLIKGYQGFGAVYCLYL